MGGRSSGRAWGRGAEIRPVAVTQDEDSGDAGPATLARGIWGWGFESEAPRGLSCPAPPGWFPLGVGWLCPHAAVHPSRKSPVSPVLTAAKGVCRASVGRPFTYEKGTQGEGSATLEGGVRAGGASGRKEYGLPAEGAFLERCAPGQAATEWAWGRPGRDGVGIWRPASQEEILMLSVEDGGEGRGSPQRLLPPPRTRPSPDRQLRPGSSNTITSAPLPHGWGVSCLSTGHLT